MELILINNILSNIAGVIKSSAVIIKVIATFANTNYLPNCYLYFIFTIIAY